MCYNSTYEEFVLIKEYFVRILHDLLGIKDEDKITIRSCLDMGLIVTAPNKEILYKIKESLDIDICLLNMETNFKNLPEHEKYGFVLYPHGWNQLLTLIRLYYGKKPKYI